MNFFDTFRGRLIFILAILLIATLGVQFYVNLQTEEGNREIRELQEQTVVAGIALGVNGMVNVERLRLKEIIEKKNDQVFFSEEIKKRLKDVIIINNDFEIEDSLSNEDYLPEENDDGSVKYHKLSEITDLPPIMGAERLGEDRNQFPNARPISEAEREALEEKSGGEAHTIPVQTNKGRWYVMVILSTNKHETSGKAARPLIYTLGILLISALTTIALVWRFTRPISKLSQAARDVAKGNLGVRVPVDKNTDEMGKLATRFNEMTAKLEQNRELEFQLQQSEKSAVVGRLASAIAHEIRNPLNYINLTLDHLKAKFTPESKEKQEPFEKLTSQLKTEVARINRQISDFLSYSRPLKLDMKPFNARELIEDSLRIVEGQAREQGIEISLSGSNNEIYGDPEILRSVFNNLFINAAQSMCNGGRLAVDISAEDGRVNIVIEDSGEGIPPENIDKIFEPYFSTKETGTGLGLAIVKKIIDDHSGEIYVESEPGKGSKFTVKLPSPSLD